LEKDDLLKNEKIILHTLNVHERCGTPVEFFSSSQWFIKLIDFKKDFLERGKQLKWYPLFMLKRYEDWVSGLKWDWSISRSHYYGVPFPVLYCKDCGEIILAKEEELPVDSRESQPKNRFCPHCNGKNFVGESDVMDTWMTSSLTPLINARWHEKNNLMGKIYPMSLRVQGFEIIRTWLFYTIVKSHLHTNSLPWKAAMISGWGLDSKGQKMSKSKGDFVTSEGIIEKYSADALRFWSCGANLGMDLRFTEEDVKAGQKLLTKIWNVTRFILMNLTDYQYKKEDIATEETDKWILAELQNVIKECTLALENYEYSQAKIALEHFFWMKLADNYLDICKDRLHNPEKRGEKARRSTQFTFSILLNTLIKLFAPILPYITEEIYQMAFREKERVASVHLTKWPKVDSRWDAQKMRENRELLIDVISLIRKFRTEKRVFQKNGIEIIYVETSGPTQ